MTRDMPEPCEFPPLDSRQKRFVWAHKEVDLAPHPVVGLTLQEDAEKFPRALDYEILDVFVRVSKQGPYLTATEENEGDNLNRLGKLMVLLRQILLKSGHHCHC